MKLGLSRSSRRLVLHINVRLETFLPRRPNASVVNPEGDLPVTDLRFKGKYHLTAAVRFLTLLLACTWIAQVNAQRVSGPTTITVTPPLPNSVESFQIGVSAPLIFGCSPIIVDGTEVAVSGSLIQVTILLTCGVFNTPSAYLSSVTVGPLPAGNYTIEHFRRTRSFTTLPQWQSLTGREFADDRNCRRSNGADSDAS